MKGLLFISHETPRFTTISSIKVALEGGCKHIQLRMKETSPQEIYTTGVEALALCKQYKAKLYIDDEVEVCQKLQADGVHLGKHDMPPSEARKLLGVHYLIGGTANTWEDILRLQKEGVDYIGLGPFRYTETKKNLASTLGLIGYKQLLNRCRENNINRPILAIGGIRLEDIPPLLKTGLAGVALSSSILQAKSPINEVKKIIQTIQNNQL